MDAVTHVSIHYSYSYDDCKCMLLSVARRKLTFNKTAHCNVIARQVALLAAMVLNISCGICLTNHFVIECSLPSNMPINTCFPPVSMVLTAHSPFVQPFGIAFRHCSYVNFSCSCLPCSRHLSRFSLQENIQLAVFGKRNHVEQTRHLALGV